MASLWKSYKDMREYETKSASFNHAAWLLLVSGLIAYSTLDDPVTLIFAVSWAMVGLAIFPVCLYWGLKALRNVLILDAYISMSLLSLMFFNATLNFFEMGILLGQVLYSLYLTNQTNINILEIKRHQILKVQK